MERLILMRHGKAEAGASSGHDYDRALTGRGRADSARVARALAEAGFAPDLALVSPAVRALQTWEAAKDAFPGARFLLQKGLYNAAPEEIWSLAEAHEADAAAVMVVAHNPGLHQLAVSLAAAAPPADRVPLDAGFPTAAAAVFDFRPRRLRLFTPKGLGA